MRRSTTATRRHLWIGARGCDIHLLLHGEIVSERRIEQVAGDSDGRDCRVATQGMFGFGIKASRLFGIDRCQEKEREPSVDVPDKPMSSSARSPNRALTSWANVRSALSKVTVPAP